MRILVRIYRISTFANIRRRMQPQPLHSGSALSKDISIGKMTPEEKIKFMTPLKEAELINPSGRNLALEFKTLANITSTQDHEDALFLNAQTQPHNRYSDIIPCRIELTIR
jgi:hypothetical protein